MIRLKEILVVSQNFYPDIFAINNYVENLVQRGHRVTVLTGLPDYTTSEIPEEYQHGKNRRENYKGADVVRVETHPRKHGPIHRSLNYLSFVRNATKFAKRDAWLDADGKPKQFDVVYVWQVSPVTQIFPASAVAKRFGIPLYVHCLDIWPECVKAMGFREGSLFYSAVKLLSRNAYKKADHISVTSKPFIEYLKTVDQIDENKISYLPQYGPQWMLEEEYSREKSETDKSVNFLFIGNVGKAQRLETLIEAIGKAKKLTANPFTLTVAGSGSDLQNCKDAAERLGLNDVITFVGSVPFEKTKELYKTADCCVFTLDGSNRIGDTLPGKVQTYMAAGKPIIASCNGAGREVIEESGCGRVAPANDSEMLASHLVEFINAPEHFSDCGKNARDYFKKHFTEDFFFSSLEKELSSLIAH